MDFSQVITQVVLLFVIMALGYFLRHKNVISGEGVKNFSIFIFYITMPAMILVSIARTESATTEDIIDVGIAAVVAYSVLILMAFAVPYIVRAPEASKGLYRFMALFGNVGYVGFPMLIAVMGKDALFLGALFNIPYNLLLYTIGIFFIISDHNKDHKMKITLKQFMNPGIIMTIIGLLIFFVGGESAIADTGNGVLIKVTEMFLDVAGLLGGVTTPLAMIVVGGSLYGVKLDGIYKNFRVIGFSLIRMTVFPLIVGLLLGLIGLSPAVIGVAVVLVGMPIATNTVIIATQYGDNVLEASEAVFISTFLMVLTAPALVWIINLVS